MIAAVVGPSARRADAWSTALLVRGDRQAAMPMDYASLIVRPANGGTREVVGGHDADILRPPTESHEESQEEPCVSSTDARS
jgi:hypothetical protein